MSEFIKKINFKKVIIIYVITLFISILFSGLFLGYLYKDKIKFVIDYEKFRESVKKNNIDEVINKLEIFKNNSDIIDVIVVNKDSLVYSLNNKYNTMLELDYNNQIYSDTDGNVYDYVKKEELYKRMFINDDDNNSYNVSVVKDKKNRINIMFIYDIINVQNGEMYLKIIGSFLIFVVMIHYLVLVLMIYQDSSKHRLNVKLWTLLVIFTDFVGVIIYLIYKFNRITCNKCFASNNKSNLYCVNCGSKINRCCKECNNIILENEKYCGHCGKLIK